MPLLGGPAAQLAAIWHSHPRQFHGRYALMIQACQLVGVEVVAEGRPAYFRHLFASDESTALLLGGEIVHAKFDFLN